MNFMHYATQIYFLQKVEQNSIPGIKPDYNNILKEYLFECKRILGNEYLFADR